MPDSGHRELAEHFDDIAQQHASATLGMWIFLCTECMFFGGLMLGYAAYRNLQPAAFQLASHHLDARLGAANTVVLLASSFTVVLAIELCRGERRRLGAAMLLVTVLLGLAFLGVKAYEYQHHYHAGFAPGLHFTYGGPHRHGVALFYFLYYTMTGMHALHMVAGIAVILGLFRWVRRGHPREGYDAPLEVGGLYWHFVDIVWIFLFPMLYLV